MQRRWRAWGSGLVLALGGAGCGGEASEPSLRVVQGDLVVAEPGAAALVPAGCGALLAAFQDHMLLEVDERAEAARLPPGTVSSDGSLFADVASPGRAASAGASRAPSARADFVDTDFSAAGGGRIYVLHGPELHVLSAEPGDTRVLASVPIEGEPLELIAEGGAVLVFSRTSGPPAGAEAAYPSSYWPQLTKLTWLHGASAEPLREVYLEGDLYLDGVPGEPVRRDPLFARAVLHQPFKVSLDSPSVSYVDIFGRPRPQVDIDAQVDEWASLARESISASVLEDYLPLTFERVAGELTPLPLSCGEHWLPPAELTREGFTSVVGLGLGDVETAVGRITLLERANVALGPEVALFARVSGAEDTPAQTELHHFALRGLRARYTASGSVEGMLDTRPGVGLGGRRLVVAMVTDEAGGNRLVTLKATRHGLTELGRTEPLPAGGYVSELLVSGSRATIVGRALASELWFVDLSDARAPALAGSLPLLGGSGLVVPLGEGQLLSFGRVAGEPGLENLALQLFDVGVSPRLLHELRYPEPAYVSGTSDTRVIRLDEARGLLAFPLQRVGGGQRSLEVVHVTAAAGFTRLGGPVAERSRAQVEECLVTFGYPTTPEYWAELEANPALFSSILGECDFFLVGPRVLRGLLGRTAAYSINGASVAAYALDGLGGPPLSVADLPQLPFDF